MFKVEMKTTCVQNEDNITRNEDNPTGSEDNTSDRSDEGGMTDRRPAGVSSAVQSNVQMPVQISDGTVSNITSTIFKKPSLNQHEHPDLGKNLKVKTFTINDNLLANPNPDILPKNK